MKEKEYKKFVKEYFKKQLYIGLVAIIIIITIICALT